MKRNFFEIFSKYIEICNKKYLKIYVLVQRGSNKIFGFGHKINPS
jgi:hypothetical protein